jgi:hypothetical protein
MGHLLALNLSDEVRASAFERTSHCVMNQFWLARRLSRVR